MGNRSGIAAVANEVYPSMVATVVPGSKARVRHRMRWPKPRSAPATLARRWRLFRRSQVSVFQIGASRGASGRVEAPWSNWCVEGNRAGLGTFRARRRRRIRRNPVPERHARPNSLEALRIWGPRALSRDRRRPAVRPAGLAAIGWFPLQTAVIFAPAPGAGGAVAQPLRYEAPW